MGRHKKKEVHPDESMEQLVKRALELFEEPYDDREGREENLPSVRYVAEKMDTTILRVRKLLITADYYSTENSRMVQRFFQQGLSLQNVMEATKLGRASVYSYLPYRGLAFNLEQTTINADRLKLFRRRKKAVDELIEHLKKVDTEHYLWDAVAAFENYPLYTMNGLKFVYKIKPGLNGLPTREILVDRKEKTISKATINLAFYKAMKIQEEEGCVSGPKKIGGFGASYLYPLFLRLGIITQNHG